MPYYRGTLLVEATMATKVTDEGQVTIPKPVLEHLGIGPGSEVAFRCAADGSIVIEKAEVLLDPDRLAKPRRDAGPGASIDADRTQQPSRFDKVVGILGPSPSTDEIMELLRGESE
jgi:AbrB family looped-hinge helix DNA binding protein